MFSFVLYCFIFLISKSYGEDSFDNGTQVELETTEADRALIAKIFLDGLAAYDSKDICGSWQETYSKLHANILNGAAPQRYIIAIAPPQGLADRLGGFVTHFLFALLTDRALLEVSDPNISSLTLAYDSPNIAINNVPSHIPLNDTLLKLAFGGYPRWINKNEIFGFYLNAGNIKKQYKKVEKRNKEIFLTRDLRTIPTNFAHTKYIYLTGNRGLSWRMFKNKYHSSTLVSKLKLKKETIFHCVFDYLLQLKPEACNGVCIGIKETLLAERAAGTIIIGIQVRVGDFVMADNFTASVPMSKAQKHMKCAQELSTLIEQYDRNTKYLFISDSVELRKTFMKSFPRKGIADTFSRPVHIHERTTQSSKDSIQSGAADIMLLSLAHIHVISSTSGFGQKAAFLSGSKYRNHVYSIPRYSKRPCDFTNFQNPSTLAEQWSGI